jgi:hypothetical protein
MINPLTFICWRKGIQTLKSLSYCLWFKCNVNGGERKESRIRYLEATSLLQQKTRSLATSSYKKSLVICHDLTGKVRGYDFFRHRILPRNELLSIAFSVILSHYLSSIVWSTIPLQGPMSILSGANLIFSWGVIICIFRGRKRPQQVGNMTQ